MNTLDSLRGAFRGDLITPERPDYDDARRVWNGAIDRRPAVIARCTGAADVMAALRHARDHDLRVAVRGGGHSLPGYSTCDGGLVIDLGPMKGVHVDPARRTAVVQPGVLWQEFDREAQAFGLATPGGEVSDTGVAGLTLGGGIGWLSRVHGLACDNLVAADLVTADGRLLHADDREHPELLWGLRGGGGNFGVVTAFTFRLHPVGPLLAGPVFYTEEQAGDVLRACRDWAVTAPDEAALNLALVTAPPAPFVPEVLRGKRMLVVAPAYVGPVSEGEAVLRTLREQATPVADLIAPMPYVALQQMVDPLTPPGQQAYVKSEFLGRLDDESIDELLEHWTTVTSPMTQILLRLMGGAISRVGGGDTAFVHRRAAYLLTVASMWPSPAEDPVPHVEWTRGIWEALRSRASCGTYVNHLGDEGADRVREAYGPLTYDRLVALKTLYDPENVFRLNQNIRPRALATA